MNRWFRVLLFSCLMLSGCFTTNISDNISYEAEVFLEMERQYGNSNGNIGNGGYILETEEDVFVVDRFEKILYKYYIKEQRLEKIAEDCSGYLNQYNQEIFYCSSDGIVSIDLVSEEIKNYYYGSWFHQFIVYGDSIYLIDNEIFQLNLKTKESIALNVIGECANLNIGDNKIFYTSLGEAVNYLQDERLYEAWDYFGYIYQMDLGGGDNKKIGNQLATNLVFHDGYLYFIPYDIYGISRMNTETYEIEVITDDYYLNFNIDNDKLICSNFNSIVMLDFAGEEVKKINPEDSFRDTYINVAHGNTFYCRFGTNRINMIDNDSYEVTTIIHDDLN